MGIRLESISQIGPIKMEIPEAERPLRLLEGSHTSGDDHYRLREFCMATAQEKFMEMISWHIRRQSVSLFVVRTALNTI